MKGLTSDMNASQLPLTKLQKLPVAVAKNVQQSPMPQEGRKDLQKASREL